MYITAGVPHGSVLGPILWNIFFDKILNISLQDEVTLLAYADDLAIVAKGKNVASLKMRLMNTIGDIQECLKNMKLELATKKTEMVILAGGYRFKTIEILVNEELLKNKDTAKYLGVIFGHNMTFRSHIDKQLRRRS